MVSLAGASAPLIFLISMVGMEAAASSLAQFASIYPSAGSFVTYITRAIGTKVAVAVGVITILGYIIAFGGIYIFVGSCIAQNVFGNPHIWGLTQIITIAFGVLVAAPVVLGLRFGVRVTVALYAFEVVLLLAMNVTILARAVTPGCQACRSPGRAASCRCTGSSDRPPPQAGPGRRAGVIVNRFLCLAQYSSVPRASVVDVLIRNYIPYLGWEQRCMDMRRTLEPGSSRRRTRY